MYERQEFVDGLHAFLDYTDPETFRNHIKEGLVVRHCSQNKEESFERRCIQRWAISELTKAILDEPENSVEDVTYRFALKMYGYACNSPMGRCGQYSVSQRNLSTKRSSASSEKGTEFIRITLEHERRKSWLKK